VEGVGGLVEMGSEGEIERRSIVFPILCVVLCGVGIGGEKRERGWRGVDILLDWGLKGACIASGIFPGLLSNEVSWLWRWEILSTMGSLNCQCGYFIGVVLWYGALKRFAS